MEALKLKIIDVCFVAEVTAVIVVLSILLGVKFYFNIVLRLKST
jgi:hypothetical protein